MGNLRHLDRVCRTTAIKSIGVILGLVGSPVNIHADIGDVLTQFHHPTPDWRDGFGFSVTGVGENILVGAPFDDTMGDDSGAAFLYSPHGNLLTSFYSPAPDTEDWFGRSVTAVGEHILISAIRDDTWIEDGGAAYLYDQQGRLLSTFFPPEPQALESFGNSLAVLDDRIAVGSYRRDGAGRTIGAGEVYMFNTRGQFLHTISNPTPEAMDQFGWSLSTVGTDRLVVAASGDSSTELGAGAVYLYDDDGSLLRTITNPTPGLFDNFGISVAGWDEGFVVTANLDDTASMNAGAAYVYDTDGNLVTTILNPRPDQDDQFGFQVEIVDGNIAIGAHGADGQFRDVGTTYLFQPDGTLLGEIEAPQARFGDGFGFSLGEVGGQLVVSSIRADDRSPDSGTVFLVDVTDQPRIPGDGDHDGDIDLADFRAMREMFGTENSINMLDITGDGNVGLADFQRLKSIFRPPSSAKAVPEPSALCLFIAGCGALALFGRRRRVRVSNV